MCSTKINASIRRSSFLPNNIGHKVVFAKYIITKLLQIRLLIIIN